MKNKRILSRALALALTLSMLPTPTLAASLGEEFTKDKNSENSYVYQELVKKLKTLAKSGGSTEITVDLRDRQVTYTADEGKINAIQGLDYELVLDALLSDLPYHLYWFKKTSSETSPGGYKVGMSASNPTKLDEISFSFAVTSDCAVTSLYEIDSAAADSAESAREKADAIIKEADNKSSTHEKLQHCFNEVKKLVSYNHEAADNNSTPYGNPWQMTSVFDEKTETNPVCEGYAKAFKYLCDGLGIDCYLVSGTMSGGTGAGAHMWNIVRLDNKSYLVDVTNCDDNTIGTPDNLFLKAPDEKNGSSYIFSIPGQGNIAFTYDSNTLNLFNSVNMRDVLELAETDYDPDSNIGGDGSGETTPDDGTGGDGSSSTTPDDGTTGGEESAPSVSYTITFDAGGGSGQMSPASAEYGYKLPECTFTAPAGYKFAGWYVQGAKFNDVIQPGIEIAMSSDLTLTATWEQIPDVATYIVTFDSNGGSVVNSQTVEENGKAAKPADPTRDGYIFKGWFSGDKEYDFSTPVTGNITLIAQWSEVVPDAVTYTVTFDSNGGSAVKSQTVEENDKVVKPSDPTREGYRFEGWFCDGKPFSFDTAITADTVLTALWTRVHTVTFDFNGLSANKSFVVDDGSYIDGLIADPVRQGYEFAGWYLNGVPFDFNMTSITADTVLTARWMQDGSLVNIYTVSFDTGVYGLNVAPQEVEGGSVAEKPADPVRSGYTFLHWLLDSVEYDFTAPVNQSITLTALWEKIQTVEPEKPDKPQKPTTPSKPSRPDRDDDDRDYVDMTGGGSGSGAAGGSSTTTEKNPDGSTTTTTKDNNGTVVENTKHPDGSSVQVKTDKNGTVTTTEKDAKGNQTQTVEKPDGSQEVSVKQKDGTKSTASVGEDGVVEAEVELSKKAVEAAAKNGEPIQLPIPEISSGKNSASSTVSVDLPNKAGSAKVVIPMDDMTPGTVVILVLPDGTEEVITQTKLTEDGLAVTLTGDSTLKVVDNARNFDDVKDSDWFSDATDFVSSRNLFAGTSETEFSPNAPMTMEMLFAVAHNFMGKPETTASGVAGAKPEDWFHTASNWAAEMGLTAGLKMDMLGTNQPISREDTAILLFNLSGKAASYIPSAEALAKLNAFSDIADMDPANRTALAWAVENGIMNGMGDGSFGFKGNNTRAQTGAVMMNFNQKC